MRGPYTPKQPANKNPKPYSDAKSRLIDMTVSQTMADALAELEAAFAEANHPWGDYMTPGLTPDQIQHETSAADLTLPDELVELWTWRSGHPDEQADGWALPGRFRIPTLSEAIHERSECIDAEILNDNWYMKTDWLIALEAEPIRFWAHTAVDKTASVSVTPVDLWDPSGCETMGPQCTMPITTIIRDMARMLREGHWGFYADLGDAEPRWMRNPEIGDITDNELGYTWAYPLG